MNNNITYHQVIACLEETDQPYAVLSLQNDVRLIILQHGARILGPFITIESSSIFWLNRALAQPESFRAFLSSGDWNLGGERVWIAPEIQYLVRDRTDFWGSVQVPAQMDPGRYVLDKSQPNQCRLSQSLTLAAFNLATGQKELHVDRLVKPVEDPLRHLSNYQNLVDGVTFAGYEQIVTLSESKHDDIASEVWNLIQLNPGGQLLIPASPQPEFSDYFEPLDSDYQVIHSNHVRLEITGDRRYKVGYKAAHVLGRLAYFNHLDQDRAYLCVRNFFNNPGASYVEEPADWPGRRGHSIHVYNDGGALGGFGELECNGQTIGGATGRSVTTDQFILWLYVGAADKVKRLVPHLVGLDI
jgi:hypothetical protein